MGRLGDLRSDLYHEADYLFQLADDLEQNANTVDAVLAHFMHTEER